MHRKKSNKRNLLLFLLICLIPICLISLVLVVKSFIFNEEVSVSSRAPEKEQQVQKQVTKKITDKLKPNKVEAPVKIDGKTVFLTFDDGPTTYLNEFISVLEKEKVPATFFFVGNCLNQLKPETASKLVKSKHSVGLHSYSHDANLLYRKTNPTFIPEMERLKNDIKNKTGITTNLVRAPYGSTYLTAGEYQNVKQKGFKLLDWNIDSNDWRYKDDSNSVIQSVMTQAKNLEQSNEPLVILFHERKNTLQALPTIIKQLKEKGYRFNSYTEKIPFTEIFKE
ncbi:polysaccharide deacetylase family protein [Listeria ivanovii]|uniref:Putative endo-1,4-beta-xylanase n=1 Tax=Listeria ivanovii (strain ATCC BAA-678 / PAM 55) TaxID=881621 RepID=G2ZAP3_LISIP|nr:polysaccharide deacetylase family protein [Listeria ivanovii]AHI54927.1 polysaccharide deacetylase [Listeria ivanovii WSLC3009]AIS64389.1 polysaccharide deacetylase [Listeria ivanovii subsp. ivanovii]MBC1760230.1 polysaccharide deacetylase [Listeria ivanovii]MBK3915284.1 polysaccharide deacetylase [Listeria ivanovii subsp. ivanovii]MBK3922412.1 polysaccharide deacetylase [Listeria ivanovii subsp. ivanovii]